MSNVLAAAITVLATSVLGFAWFNAIAARPDWAFVLVFAAVLTLLTRARLSCRALLMQALSAAIASCSLTIFVAKDDSERGDSTSQGVFISAVTLAIWEWVTFLGFSSAYATAMWTKGFRGSRSGWKNLREFVLDNGVHAFWLFAGVCLVFGVALTITNQLLPAIPLVVIAGLSFLAATCCVRMRPVLVLLLFGSVVALVLLSIRLAELVGTQPQEITMIEFEGTLAPKLGPELPLDIEPFAHVKNFGSTQPPLDVKNLRFPKSGKVVTAPWFELGHIRSLLASSTWTNAQLNKIRALLVCALIADGFYFIVTGGLLLSSGRRRGPRKPPPIVPPIIAVTSGSSRQTPHFQGTASLHPTPDDSPLAHPPRSPSPPPPPPPSVEVRLPAHSPVTHPSVYGTPGSYADNILFSHDYRPVFIELKSPAKEEADVMCRVPTLIGTMKRETLYGTPGSHTRLSSFASPMGFWNFESGPFAQDSEPRQGCPFASLPCESRDADDIEDQFITAVSPVQPMRPPLRDPGSPLLEFHYEIVNPSRRHDVWQTPQEHDGHREAVRTGGTEPVPLRVPRMGRQDDRWISTYTPPVQSRLPKLRRTPDDAARRTPPPPRQPGTAWARTPPRGPEEPRPLQRWGSLDTFSPFQDEDGQDR